MDAKVLRPYFLAALVVASGALTFFIFRPFLVVLTLAAIFALVLQPLYRGVLHHMHGWPGLAAFVTMLISVVCIVIPLTFITVQIVSDAQNLYVSLSDGSGEVYLDTMFQHTNDVVAQYIPSLALSRLDISVSVTEYLRGGLSWVIQNLGGAFVGAVQMFISFFIFLIALYYLLRDGVKLKQTIVDISPLAETEDAIVFARLELAINSVIRGSLTIAVIQGILTGIGFTLFGVPNSILWGVAAALLALIPGIGTSLVLIPGVAYLFIIGLTTPAVGLLVWSIFAVGLIDNFLGPRLVGRGMQLHPLIVLLSVFGGIAFFGPAGLFLGPICTRLLFALLSIYQHISKKTVQ